MQICQTASAAKGARSGGAFPARRSVGTEVVNVLGEITAEACPVEMQDCASIVTRCCSQLAVAEAAYKTDAVLKHRTGHEH